MNRQSGDRWGSCPRCGAPSNGRGEAPVCPRCGTAATNVQGLLDCPACQWPGDSV